MRRYLVSTLCALLGAPLSSQEVVSPDYHRDFRGNAVNDMPFGGGFTWSGTIRYQQVHDDLRGRSLTIRNLSFRPHRNAAPSLGGSVDFELLMGAGDRANSGRTFASNYTSTPQTVVARRSLNIPARSGVSQPFVEPWDLTIPLDVPYAHSGAQDLVWESRTYARNGGNPFGSYFACDYAVQSTGYTVPNTVQSYSFGPSCGSAVGITAPIATLPAGTELSLDLNMQAAPRDTFCAFLLGVQNPQLPVPTAGCISQSYTDALTVVIGNPDPQGRFLQSWVIPWQQSFASAEVFLQGASFSLNGLAMLTQGRHLKLPPGPSPRIPVHQVIGSPVNVSTGVVPVTPQQVIVRFGR